jgi:nanoRNase/pAp phosphatase (c-di-AMP/oligoRNAs hydrolase)
MRVAGAVGFAGALQSVTESPGLVALSVLLAAALVVAGWLLVTLFRKAPGERFQRVLQEVGEVGVLMHPNPDPDAMSCALAVQELANNRGTAVAIYYPGQIRHHENRAFEAVLDVDFDQVENAKDIEEDEVVLVDHNEPRGFPGADGIDPLAVVDHHPGGGEGREFTDVRTDNGACATILSQYFEDLGWEPLGPDDDGEDVENPVVPTRLSTALLHGIQSDTKNLTNGCTDGEFEAASFLYRGIDPDKLDRVANPEIDADSLEVKAKAITDRDVRGPFAVSDVGAVSNPDAIPQAADELRRLEGVNAVVVLGETDGTVQLSGRSADDRVHMGKVLEAVVEDIPLGNAGGHARMGGGQIPVEHMEGLGPSEGTTREELMERLFEAMNGEI